MISLDMKYTALYWALRYVETEPDVHVKSYMGYKITVFAEEQRVDYGGKIRCLNEKLTHLNRHKDFVVLECVDRLLSKGHLPQEITIDGRDNCPDIIVNNCAVFCEQWGEDFEQAKNTFRYDEEYEQKILYTSRLVSGLLEYKNVICATDGSYSHKLFEDGTTCQQQPIQIECVDDLQDFETVNDKLVCYIGRSKIVKVPFGIRTIAAGAFWNNVYVEQVILPNSLEQLGGDCFYYCQNLKRVNIPPHVRKMGNNPFAGCPKLQIENYSKHFILEDGVLFDKAKSNIIHYSAWKKESEYVIPSGVKCIGKHCFFNCNNLRKITVPASVIHFENNPFSGCRKLGLVNHSESYVVENGVIYNQFRTTVVGCLNGAKIKQLRIPETVTLISRNSFWGCKHIKRLTVTKNVSRIGYNPFASCTNLWLESESPLFPSCNGVIYNKDKTQILCATDEAIGVKFAVPNGVTHINRGAFSGCERLQLIDLNCVTCIEKSAFTDCTSLEYIYLPDSVTYVGQWAFAYCKNLKKVSISGKTFVDKNAFNQCPANIEWRS